MILKLVLIVDDFLLIAVVVVVVVVVVLRSASLSSSTVPRFTIISLFVSVYYFLVPVIMFTNE